MLANPTFRAAAFFQVRLRVCMGWIGAQIRNDIYRLFWLHITNSDWPTHSVRASVIPATGQN
jgi:hypothetical protein